MPQVTLHSVNRYEPDPFLCQWAGMLVLATPEFLWWADMLIPDELTIHEGTDMLILRDCTFCQAQTFSPRKSCFTSEQACSSSGTPHLEHLEVGRHARPR